MDDPFLLRRAGAAELFLIRHGDAVPEEDEIIPGGAYDDLPLSRKGRGQAGALARRLGEFSFNALYSSPLRRCQETAAPLAEKLGLTPQIIPDLKEIRLGEVGSLPPDTRDLAALTRALQERQTDIIRLIGEDGNWDAIPGSEPSKEFRRRVVRALDEIASQHLGQRVLVFAHGGVINAYAAETLSLPGEFFYPAANTSINVIRVAGPRRVIFVLNDIAHLAGA